MMISTPNKIEYRGEKAVYKFMERMLEEVRYCSDIIKLKQQAIENDQD